MKNLTGNWRRILTIGVIFMILLIYANSVALGNKIPMDPANNLQQLGYPTDTVEQILTATKSESYFVRHQALEVLTERKGKEAIPTLRLFLGDPQIRVRSRAAHFLGTLGDKNGIEQMRKDLKELAPYNGAPLPHEPNAVPAAIQKRKGGRNYYLREALIVARVLAELGDRRGYELAARMALEGPLAVQRYEAVFVLIEIAKTDEAILQAEGIDPVSVLCTMAESEKRHTVFRILTNSVQDLDVDMAERVLKRAMRSPHQSKEMRIATSMILNKVRARMKAAENNPKDSANCCD